MMSFILFFDENHFSNKLFNNIVSCFILIILSNPSIYKKIMKMMILFTPITVGFHLSISCIFVPDMND